MDKCWIQTISNQRVSTVKSRRKRPTAIRLEPATHLSKSELHYYTDAIKENLIPKELSKTQTSFGYANEADLLNVALFGITAKQLRDANPEAAGNIRDSATIEQLVVLSNMESINAVLIHQGLQQTERLIQLNKIAITQMKSLINNKNIKKLK